MSACTERPRRIRTAPRTVSRYTTDQPGARSRHIGSPPGYIWMLTWPAAELMLAFGDLFCVRTVRSTSRLGSTFTSLASRFVSTTLRLALSRRRAPAESSLQHHSEQYV